MFFTLRTSSILVLGLALAVPSFGHTAKHNNNSKKHATASSARRRHGHAKVKTAGAWKHHGQQGIDDGRAQEIQEALVREHYLNGTPSGQWDAESRAAMQRYQADHGWQTKRIPDARAIIQLGLGPLHQANPSTELANGQATVPSGGTESFGAPRK